MCLERINQRNRKGEENISFDYLKQVSTLTRKLYDEWEFNKLCISTTDYPDKFNKHIELFINELIQRFYEDNEIKQFRELVINEKNI